MLILSEKQIQSIYSMKDAIKDLENALKDAVSGNIINPKRTVLDIPKYNASALYMPCAMNAIGKAAVKVVTIFPENPAKGMKTTQGVIMLSDTTTGEHLACLNASYLTRLRTGAISGIATSYLAKNSASSVAVIGCGAMAEEQLQAVLEVRNITTIHLYNRTKQKASQFAEKLARNHSNYRGEINIMERANDAVSNADIVICSTRSKTPVFAGYALQEGTHINGVGSYLPDMQEVDEETILRCSKIVVDTIEGTKEEAGDLIIPSNVGIWNFTKVHGDISELSTKKISGRENEEEITFFKSVGTAYFDLAVAAAVYSKAIQENIGTRVEL
ncbi:MULTISPECIES: ornithine cyclodeaminase family protein [Bacillus]|uniref:ornithine cyclodeaminase family protein n=1 Tax=Bacillus TaxID=1386 RepID=UPI0003027C0B|nr:MULTISPECIES: NAD(P)-binding domain-containing protein [Bacillus]